MKLFEKIEKQIDRELTDSEKTLVLMAYTIGKNDGAMELMDFMDDPPFFKS